MHSDRHARGGVKLPGEDFFGDFYTLHESLVRFYGVELYVILVPDFISNLKNTV